MLRPPSARRTALAHLETAIRQAAELLSPDGPVAWVEDQAHGSRSFTVGPFLALQVVDALDLAEQLVRTCSDEDEASIARNLRWILALLDPHLDTIEEALRHALPRPTELLPLVEARAGHEHAIEVLEFHSRTVAQCGTLRGRIAQLRRMLAASVRWRGLIRALLLPLLSGVGIVPGSRLYARCAAICARRHVSI